MSRYDYMEDYRVRYLKEKCASLELKIDLMSERYKMLEKELKKELESLNKNCEQKKKVANFWYSRHDEVKDRYLELKDEIKLFNALPWYKKMRYKFREQ